MKKRILCVPNFSEGRDAETARALVEAAQAGGARAFESSWDADHHRMVLAFEGTPTQVFRAFMNLAQAAIQRIDLRSHKGEHPRLGAMDVAPLIPLENVPVEEAVQFSHRIGRALARRFKLPVYLYEKSAKAGRIADLPTLRKGGFEAWVGKRLIGERAPDFGPKRLHPTAGAVVIGVREALIAFNVNLQTGDMEAAKTICRRLRELRDTDPELAGVRALAVYLSSRRIAQVSLNITCPDETNLFEVYRRVVEITASLGVQVLESELIGVLRQQDLVKAFGKAINASIRQEQIVTI